MELNHPPSVYKTDALTDELRAPLIPHIEELTGTAHTTYAPESLRDTVQGLMIAKLAPPADG